MKLQLCDVGPWIRFPETVHELYAHLAEMIGILFYLLYVFHSYFCRVK